MKAILITIFISLSFTANSQSLLRVLAKGFLSGLGEGIGSSLFDDDDQAQINLLNERYFNLENRVSDLEENMEDISSQIDLMGISINALDLRLTEVENNLPYGAFGLSYTRSNIGQVNFKQLNSLVTLRMNKAQVGLRLNAGTFDLSNSVVEKRVENNFINIVEYISFGSEYGAVYANLGEIKTSSFGHDFMFRNYSNNTLYNDRKFGFKAGIQSPIIGVNIFSSNLQETEILAGGINIRPFAVFENDNSSSFLHTQIGISYITDNKLTVNQPKILTLNFQTPFYSAIEDEDEMSSALYVYGNYAEYNNLGKGAGLGFAADFSQETTSMGFWIEYKYLGEQFLTGYFNKFYDANKFENTTLLSESLVQKTSSSIERTIGLDVSLKGLSLSGYIVEDTSEEPDSLNNYFHLEGTFNMPITITEEKDIILSFKTELDQRGYSEYNFGSVINGINSSNINSFFSFIGSIHIPVGEKIDMFSRFENRDFFVVSPNGEFFKTNSNTLLFGLQYNFGFNDEY